MFELFLGITVIFLIIITVLQYYRKTQAKEKIITDFYEMRERYIAEHTTNTESLNTRISYLTQTNERLQLDLEEQELRAISANKRSLTLGQNIIKGELTQILASFYLLTEYDSIALISSVSKNASFDLIGVKSDSLDFIEVKTGSAPLSNNESNIQKIIESGNVHYRIIEGKLPKMDLKIRNTTSNIIHSSKHIE